jgi:hypothetical protein
VNRKELREEVVESGFENVLKGPGGEARINRWIQQAIREICDFKPWPFLFATKEGAAPLEIADLGHVVSMLDVTNSNPLDPTSLHEVLLANPKLDAVGNAESWYIDDGTKIKVYPSSSAVFKVYYKKVPAELADNDVPIIPVDYHDVIVDRVRVKAYKRGDNNKAAAEALADYERQLGLMVHALMKPNYDKERRIARSGAAGDYL